MRRDWRSLLLMALFALAREARAADDDPVSSVRWDRHPRLLWLADFAQLPVLPWTLIVLGHGPLTTAAAPFPRCVTTSAGWTA